MREQAGAFAHAWQRQLDREARILRRLWFPISLSIAIIALTGRVASITNDRGGPAPAGVSFELPWTYVLFSPFSRVLDGLTLLANAQSIAIFVTIAVLLVTRVVLTRRRARRALWKRLAVTLVILIIAIAAFEAAAVFLRRDMAAVRVSDPDVVIADFHSHTRESHDVRKSYSAEDNRDWHRSGGFDIAYITDHVKFGSVVAARPFNPARAGDGTSLLSGVEGRYHRIISTIVLGVDERDAALFNRRGNLLASTTASGLSPVTMIALPSRNLDSLNASLFDSTVALPNLSAIELVDAAPRGLSQLDRQENRIRALASRLGLIMVAASNNHGFGRAVAGWNLMRVPGWRSLSPDSVGRLIEQQFRERRRDAVTIVRRTRPGVHGAAVAFTLPVLAWQMLGSLTLLERLSWLAWIWLLAIVLHKRRRVRSPVAQ